MKASHFVLIFALAAAPCLRGASPGAQRPFAMLRGPIGALDLGLAGLQQPWAEGEGALSLDPARLSLGSGWKLGLEHQFGLLGAATDGAWMTLQGRGAWKDWGQGFSFYRVWFGSFERVDELGYPSGGQIEPGAQMARWGLGWSASGTWAFGLALGYLREQIATVGVDAGELSLSADWRPWPELSAALLLRGSGAGMASGAEAVASTSWEPIHGAAHSLRVGLQASRPELGPLTAGLALTYEWRHWLTVRSGWQGPTDGSWAGSGFGLGLGLAVGRYHFDAGWKDLGVLGSVQAISLSLAWGATPAAPEALVKARTFAQRGMQKEALWAYHGYLQANPGDKMAWIEMAQLYQALGHRSDAKTCLQRALTLDPKDEDLALKIGAIEAK